jgi:LPPG:FO 2-phospho-L-lactate transferase
MTDQAVRTRIQSGQEWWSLQEFLIRRRGQGTIRDVDFRGRGAARPTPEVLTAIAGARAIIIGPSNPVISIGPILSVPGMSEALAASPAPTVAVSPIVKGAIVKGPTESFLRWREQSLDAAGIANLYSPLLDGIVADERSAPLPTLECDTLMDGPESRRALAKQALNFALALT